MHYTRYYHYYSTMYTITPLCHTNCTTLVRLLHHMYRCGATYPICSYSDPFLKIISTCLPCGCHEVPMAICIIYHDFLPPPRRGNHVKSHNTHIIINMHPLAHLLDICSLVFSALFNLQFIPTALCDDIPALSR